MTEKKAAPGDEWKCSSCTRVDQSIPMIGCDSCDSWFHWSCVGIVMEPRQEDVWICSDCRRVKPVRKAKDKFKVSGSSTYSAQPSSTRPASGTSTAARSAGPIVKTGSGHPKKSSSSSLTSKQTSSSSAIAGAAASSRTAAGSGSGRGGESASSQSGSQGWVCASCQTW